MNKLTNKNIKLIAVLFLGIFCSCSCKKSNTPPVVGPPQPLPVDNTPSTVQFWLTDGNKGNLFSRQSVPLNFNQQEDKNYPTIAIDSAQTYQSIDGFGYSLTGGSAYLLNSLDDKTQDETLKNLFSTTDNSIGVSYLRISVGASDLNANVFTYDDVPNSQTDIGLAKFSINPDRQDLIPILKKILAINPQVKIMATPWTAPSWMKSNESSKGGSLKTEYYAVYAQYFVKYLNAMKAEGINIEAITPQNEPLNPDNNPSMVMTATEEANFIKNNLGPALQAAGLNTKIIVYDHNADVPQYPLTILQDADAAKYVDGAAFHLYAGSITALSQVHNAYPDKNLYFTEQYTPITGSFNGDLSWHITNLIIGAPRNWSRNVLEWNLASDPNLGPHTPGGCSTCLGALTISSSSAVSKNVSYYIIAHASKFVRPGAVRVSSTSTNDLPSVAFKNADGKKVLIVTNNGSQNQKFNVNYMGKTMQSSLNPGSVATYVW
ncbi:glucosylceramidase [Pedobacter sp. SD-b]|uniref:Glucosylceramidase n=1 Tax=Pedobacter segetis TaxID=2793069 RepID=A0ABS1BHB1_9SPHI|nr:glycoside hydrolase family 30 beta sandwich domain-containing protein [Pedobacter segetis]MBK0382261.1 glucosylceramidase [Pedobacter segetis]